MARLYVKSSFEESGGAVREGEEDSDWPSYEDTYRTTTFERASFTNHDSYYDTVEVKDELKTCSKVYLVVVRYGDGGTFSSTIGYTEIIGGYATEEEARIFKAAEEEMVKANDQSLFGPGGFKPWFGYFGSFESCDIEELEIV
jgi:hypothetical protein